MEKKCKGRLIVKSTFGKTYLKLLMQVKMSKLCVLNQILCRELIEETLSGNGFLILVLVIKQKISLLCVDLGL